MASVPLGRIFFLFCEIVHKREKNHSNFLIHILRASVLLVFKKTFYFEIIVDLQKICNDSIESSQIPPIHIADAYLSKLRDPPWDITIN